MDPYVKREIIRDIRECHGNMRDAERRYDKARARRFYEEIKRLKDMIHSDVPDPFYVQRAEKYRASIQAQYQSYYVPANLLRSVVALAFDEPKKLPPLPRSTQFGEIIAYRLWIVHPSGLLQSVAMTQVIWIPGEPMEGKIINEYAAGQGQGIHAFKNKDDAAKEIFTVRTWDTNVSNPEMIFAVGTVKLWGDVIEHERGYRATRASVNSIDEVISSPPIDPFFRVMELQAPEPREDLISLKEKLIRRYIK